MEVKVGKRYRHFKGKIMEVVCIALDSETLEKKVVYKENNSFWIRDYNMFVSKVDKDKYPDVKQEYRFEEIDD